MKQKIKFRVFELGTDKEVTHRADFYIDNNGNLLCDTENTGVPIYVAKNKYYYKLEITLLS